jgi:hypothetical protein
MKMELPRDLHLNDIKRALGLLERQNGGSELVGRFSLFGAGILVGAGLALLLTPFSGEELREKVHDRVDELRGEKSADANENDKA